jgi:hypothetical protein
LSGAVLGVVDDEKFATREGERDIQSPRFGLRRALRGDDVFEARQTVAPRLQGRKRLSVVRFDYDFDIELGAGIVRYFGANATSERLRPCLDTEGPS